METLNRKDIKKCMNGNALNYMEYLEKEKYDSGKKGTAGLYKATRSQFCSLKRRS